MTKSCVCGKYWPIVGGNAITAAAKMTGITPAMFTRSGMYVEPPAVMRRPTIRFAYWIGIRRWPSWMKTIAAMIESAISGKKSFSIGPPFHQAAIPIGAPTRIEAKMSSEMPLPIPRLVISSPIHISSVQPTVSVMMISVIRPRFASRTPWRRKRNAYPVDWAAASTTVR